jgi:hypothetical protein
VEVLVGVHTSLLWGGPTGGINTGGNLGWIILLDPVDEESDCILSAFDAAKRSGCSAGAGSGDFEWPIAWNQCVVDIDMMRVQVVSGCDLVLSLYPNRLGETHEISESFPAHALKVSS